MKIVTVNDKVYQMSDELADNLVGMAKDAMNGSYAIYALSKGDRIELRKDKYNTPRELRTAATKYIKAGFFVSCLF